MVIVHNKSDFDKLMTSYQINDDNVEELADTCFISILDTNIYEGVGGPYFKSNHKNVLRLSFDDVDRDCDIHMIGSGEILSAKFITHEQALELINFVTENAQCNNFILHCTAGIARSGAVGTFVNDLLCEDYFKFKANNTRIQPNPNILAFLNKTLRELNQ